jgi:hypothetical protein
VKRGGTDLVWSRVDCPDCSRELFYDRRVRSQTFPHQVYARCMKGHTWHLSEPIAAEETPAYA